MDDERLERRLREVRLSAPRVTLAEIEARARQRHGSRPLLRLALATVAVWLAAWGAQVAVEHGLQGPVAAHAAVAADHHSHGAVPGLLVRRQLMDELGSDSWDAVAPVEAAPQAKGDAPKRGSAAVRRRSGYV